MDQKGYKNDDSPNIEILVGDDVTRSSPVGMWEVGKKVEASEGKKEGEEEEEKEEDREAAPFSRVVYKFVFLFLIFFFFFPHFSFYLFVIV